MRCTKSKNWVREGSEKIIEFKYGTHIPHNRIHQVLLSLALDDSSRYVLAGDEFDAATGEKTALVLWRLCWTSMGGSER
ncbi:MAG: hypothetical protein U9N09_08675 [Euryarchaeota archaeon]|nr:hypothetical protein [Euryarchaeota archaeon]